MEEARPMLGRTRGTLVFGIALFVRLSLVLGMDADDPFFGHPRADSILFLERAARIVAGHLTAGQVFEQGPLYPYLLAPFVAVFGPEPILPVAIAQCLLDAITALVIAVLAARLAERPVAGFLAGILYALGREPAFYVTKLMAVTPLLFLLALILLFAETRPLLAGISGGLAALLWPGALPIVGLVAIATWRLPTFLKIALGAAIAICPATAHNFAYGHRLVLISSHGGVTFYQGNNPTAEGTYTTAGGGDDPRTQVEQARRFASKLAGRELSAAEASDYLAHAARAWLLSNPKAALVLFGKKLFLAYSGRETAYEYSMAFERARFAPSMGWLPVTFSVLSVLAPASLLVVLAESRRRRAASTTIALVAGTLFTLLAVFVSTRYKMPLFIAACPWVGVALTRGWQAQRSIKIAALAACLPGLLLARYDARHVPIHLQSYCDLADVRVGEHDLAAALLEVQIALGLRSDFAPALERRAYLLDLATRVTQDDVTAPTASIEPAPGPLAASAALLVSRGNITLAHRLARLALASGGRDPATRRLALEALDQAVASPRIPHPEISGGVSH